MPFALPSPEEITRSLEAVAEAALARARPEVDPVAIARAVRSEKGVIAILLRATALSLYNNHLHLRWLGDQLLPDTAEAEYLDRHASVWGIWRRPATRAVGRAVFSGLPGVVIPLGLTLRSPEGALLAVDIAGSTVSAGGTVSVPVRAVAGGAAANASAGAVLPVVDTLPGLTPQAAVADTDGIAGGTDIEDDASLLARLLARIRQAPHGGAAFDYVAWIQNRFAAAKVSVRPGWVGRGTVGVIVAMGSAEAPRAPTAPEMAEMLAYLGPLNSAAGVRPVTAEVVIVPVTLAPLAIEMATAPDNLSTRAAIEAAIRLFLATEATIGEPVPFSRLSEAASAARGEFKHRFIAPVADVAAAPTALPTFGSITWAAYP
jgi:uncharacterized phage protein gp47/JayE